MEDAVDQLAIVSATFGPVAEQHVNTSRRKLEDILVKVKDHNKSLNPGKGRGGGEQRGGGRGNQAAALRDGVHTKGKRKKIKRYFCELHIYHGRWIDFALALPRLQPPSTMPHSPSISSPLLPRL